MRSLSMQGLRLYFNPLSPHGERRHSASPSPPIFAVQSTLPAWGETSFGIPLPAHLRISIHSPRMGRDHRFSSADGSARISIHSPRMGRDVFFRWLLRPDGHFNPLSPHGERPFRLIFLGSPLTFQSTLPAWGETAETVVRAACNGISIHSPRMGRDTGHKPHFWPNIFQSTLPAWGETRWYPCTPTTSIFQSTLPAWGETKRSPPCPRPAEFQSTLPAWGETEKVMTWWLQGQNFNPLSPHGERRHAVSYCTSHRDFNPLSPHGERLLRAAACKPRPDFNPLSPHGERLDAPCAC